ncbi:MAG: ribosome small subunit-dependent GTPase A, partial [Rikenellaceae bacterium]
MDGIVIKATGSWYRVEQADSHDLYNCRIRGKMRMDGLRVTNPVTVGDHVTFVIENCENELQGVITAITPRRNFVV